ncbi:hypothetical protein CLUG_05693 [Clavispora lusitaniae ATCC 42720]|uniref:Uncharacterized protein n=1 Tax=Clavispora lusitaniae (strain ATCC 42720) TaxID=306902 RepID=C4YBW5_CLAL4|nr:uncharacterized protein CLUG_05693 [Clavispora lusitaniae ATCC 42720]EEQ41564.1 hypothetical protein CLUG_05693 [Clavispora lusitaniae ATCC 42720]
MPRARSETKTFMNVVKADLKSENSSSSLSSNLVFSSAAKGNKERKLNKKFSLRIWHFVDLLNDFSSNTYLVRNSMILFKVSYRSISTYFQKLFMILKLVNNAFLKVAGHLEQIASHKSTAELRIDPANKTLRSKSSLEGTKIFGSTVWLKSKLSRNSEKTLWSLYSHNATTKRDTPATASGFLKPYTLYTNFKWFLHKSE